MTVQLNFDTGNQQRVLRLVEWLQEIGLIKSFQVPSTSLPSETEDGLSEAHKRILDERISLYKNNPSDVLNWNDVKKEIEQMA